MLMMSMNLETNMFFNFLLKITGLEIYTVFFQDEMEYITLKQLKKHHSL